MVVKNENYEGEWAVGKEKGWMHELLQGRKGWKGDEWIYEEDV